MSELKISRRYAKALFVFSQEEKLTEQIFNDMALMHQVLSENKDLKRFLKSPIIKTHLKSEVLKEIFDKKIQPITFSFIKLILTQRREFLLDFISCQFIELYKDSKGIKTAKIKTATELDSAMQQQIVKLLEKQTSAKVVLEIEEKPDLIGGFILSMDNQQIDTSVRNKLLRLKAEFDDNLYVRKF